MIYDMQKVLVETDYESICCIFVLSILLMA